VQLACQIEQSQWTAERIAIAPSLSRHHHFRVRSLATRKVGAMATPELWQMIRRDGHFSPAWLASGFNLIGRNHRLSYGLCGRLTKSPPREVTMADPARRAKLLRELEQEFIPDYDATNMPSADKRTAYALEHIAFRVARIEHSLSRIAAAIESVLAKR
jgi:hypothetical protein